MIKNYKNHLTHFSIIAAALLNSGCAEYQIRKLYDISPQGSEFSQALTNEYKDFALHETREFADEKNAEYFALKGQEAAFGRGEQVMPEDISTRDLPCQSLPELRAQCERLISALTCHGREKAPQFAASAQRSFDEWVEQQEERWQYDDIAAARQRYYENIKRVEEAICSLDHAPTFHIYFKTGSYHLNPRMQKRIKKIIAAVGEHCHCKIVLTGRTDASGTRAFNLDLSKKRAEAVKQALISQNVAESRIVARGFGQVPRSPKHKRKNRQVEIIIH